MSKDQNDANNYSSSKICKNGAEITSCYSASRSHSGNNRISLTEGHGAINHDHTIAESLQQNDHLTSDTQPACRKDISEEILMQMSLRSDQTRELLPCDEVATLVANPMIKIKALKQQEPATRQDPLEILQLATHENDCTSILHSEALPEACSTISVTDQKCIKDCIKYTRDVEATVDSTILVTNFRYILVESRNTSEESFLFCLQDHSSKRHLSQSSLSTLKSNASLITSTRSFSNTSGYCHVVQSEPVSEYENQQLQSTKQDKQGNWCEFESKRDTTTMANLLKYAFIKKETESKEDDNQCKVLTASENIEELDEDAVQCIKYKEDVKGNNECNDISIECKKGSYQNESIGCGNVSAEVSIECKEDAENEANAEYEVSLECEEDAKNEANAEYEVSLECEEDTENEANAEYEVSLECEEDAENEANAEYEVSLECEEDAKNEANAEYKVSLECEEDAENEANAEYEVSLECKEDAKNEANAEYEVSLECEEDAENEANTEYEVSLECEEDTENEANAEYEVSLECEEDTENEANAEYEVSLECEEDTKNEANAEYEVSLECEEDAENEVNAEYEVSLECEEDAENEVSIVCKETKGNIEVEEKNDESREEEEKDSPCPPSFSKKPKITNESTLTPELLTESELERIDAGVVIMEAECILRKYEVIYRMRLAAIKNTIVSIPSSVPKVTPCGALKSDNHDLMLIRLRHVRLHSGDEAMSLAKNIKDSNLHLDLKAAALQMLVPTQKEEALTILEHALKLGKSSKCQNSFILLCRIHYKLERCYYRKKNTEKAEMHIEEAMRYSSMISGDFAPVQAASYYARRQQRLLSHPISEEKLRTIAKLHERVADDIAQLPNWMKDLFPQADVQHAVFKLICYQFYSNESNFQEANGCLLKAKTILFNQKSEQENFVTGDLADYFKAMYLLHKILGEDCTADSYCLQAIKLLNECGRNGDATHLQEKMQQPFNIYEINQLQIKQ